MQVQRRAVRFCLREPVSPIDHLASRVRDLALRWRLRRRASDTDAEHRNRENQRDSLHASSMSMHATAHRQRHARERSRLAGLLRSGHASRSWLRLSSVRAGMLRRRPAAARDSRVGLLRRSSRRSLRIPWRVVFPQTDLATRAAERPDMVVDQPFAWPQTRVAGDQTTLSGPAQHRSPLHNRRTKVSGGSTSMPSSVLRARGSRHTTTRRPTPG